METGTSLQNLLVWILLKFCVHTAEILFGKFAGTF